MNAAPRFSGEHVATLDPEGRILLPMPLRNAFNPGREDRTLMANLEPEGCIALREPERWTAYVDRLRARASDAAASRRFLMYLAATSAGVKCDRQGRVRVPDGLLQKAGIERAKGARSEVVLSGNFDDIRIWSPERWAAFEADARAHFGADLALLHAESVGESTR